MEMAELKKLNKDKRQAVHQQLSQCQLGRDSEVVRKNASKALLLVLQAIKKPAVTRTSGQVMGELTIWPSS